MTRRLNTVKIDESNCTGCGLCVDVCPVKAITVDEVAKIDQGFCAGCCVCMDECPNDAIYLAKKEPAPAFRPMEAPASSRSSKRIPSWAPPQRSSNRQAGFQQTESGGGLLGQIFDFFNTPSRLGQGRGQGSGRGQGCRRGSGSGRGSGGGWRSGNRRNG